MFSGLVRQFAKVRYYQNNILCLESNLNPNLGDSIAVNGACLTAIESYKDYFCVELSQETKQSIAGENLQGIVHIEPALCISDGLHGHIVQGHIDAVGIIRNIALHTNQYVFHIHANPRTLMLMVAKGSVCIDGISLTINRVEADFFELVIIPHTFYNTLFHTYTIGRRVNIETDVIVRSIAHITSQYFKRLDSDKQNLTIHRNLTQEIYDSIALAY